MEIKIDTGLTQFKSSGKQIELLESIEYIHDPEIETNELLSLHSLNAFTKRYFENNYHRYKQVISASEGFVTCKVFIDGTQISEATARSFNHARTQAAVLAMQDHNFDLLKQWLGLHKDHLQSYLSV
jgi:predicted GNAT superfamily acetyltransferase